MKKIIYLTMVMTLYMHTILAQVPESFNYQAAIRNSSGEPVTEQDISIKINILQTSETGTSVYSETHSLKTNNKGLVNLKIGKGTNKTGNISSISWGASKYFLKISIDETGGSNYVSTGSSQLLSVPYAIYAKSANNLGDKNVYSTSNDTLFVVKDHSGNVVFAVFPDGAQVIVNQTQKGSIGGFAVSGRNPSKAGTDFNILSVTEDSTRIIFNNTGKGNIGGFAVSGRNPSKAGLSSLVNLFPNNYFIGHESGTLTTGLYNSFFGYNTGFSNVAGSRNIFIGYECGYTNYNGNNNLFFGNQAGYTNYSGANNIFMGNGAGYKNQAGSSNMFFGYQAGYENTSGDHNTFIGYQSGQLNQEGFYNVYIGYQSGYISGVDGIYKNYRNVFIGPYAGYNSSGVSESVYIGYDAGRYNQNGARNTFVGGNAGENNTVGYDNSFYGNAAGENTKGVGNTYIGSATAWSDTASWRCTYVGTRAGEDMVTKSYRNTFIGGWAGRDKTGGSYNTLLGFGAGQNAAEGQGNVFIGYMAGQNETSNNKLYIDNSSTPTPLIYGNFQHDSIIIHGDLHITGNITATGTNNSIPDYVFENNYKLESIEEHALFMWKKKHLPALKSAKQIKEEGKFNINERREQMLEELEKAHIYIEQLNERIKVLENENKKLSKIKLEIETIKKEIYNK